MSTEPVEYLADLLPDGHLSIPEKIRKKLERASKKKVRVYIDLEIENVTKTNHPAFGIWADRFPEIDSGEVARKLRGKLESRTDGF